MAQLHNRLIQWNVQGLTTSKEDLLKLIEDYQPYIISVQETFLSDDYAVVLKGYNGIHKQGHYNYRYHGGVSLYVHSSLPMEEIQVRSRYQMVAARVSLPNHTTITATSIYIPGREELVKNTLFNDLNNLPSPKIIMGDFNAHGENWGNAYTDRRGRLMDEVFVDDGLNVVNDGTATHISGTVLDLTAVSPILETELLWQVVSSPRSSDHHPVMITLNARQVEDGTDHEIYNFKKGKWKNIPADEIWENLPAVHEDPQVSVQLLYGVLEGLLDKYVPKFIKRRFFPKPWWNQECSEAWRRREALYRVYKRTHSIRDKIEWKRARALATRTFRKSKIESWRSYISSLNIHTQATSVWEKIRKIRGKPPSPVHILKHGNRTYTTVSDISNHLAETFQATTSETNYSPEFLSYKETVERVPVDFTSDNQETYNALFTMEELERAILSNKDNSPGPDSVSNQLLKAIPEKGLIYILAVFNQVWRCSYFDWRWKMAIVIPIPKPGKDHSDATNYRPISLTSCLCKTLEKMINWRLVEYLEYNKLFCDIQCGFRRYRSTVDHMVRLDTFVRKAFANGENVISVFFDMEKAYDKTWRYGILNDLRVLGLRGRLPMFIKESLQDRVFKIRLRNCLSDIKVQETGIAQGSNLSVTLFAVKMNSLYSVIPKEMHASLYVDDIQLAYSHSDTTILHQTVQRGVTSIERWARKNGFTFSLSKTYLMQFYQTRAPFLKPQIYLSNALIPEVEIVKFLGLYWDPKLTWIPHIAQLKSKCMKQLNLLRTVTAYEWGADMEVGMRLYKAVIRPRLDYGSIVYGSASAAALSSLEVVANEAMRIASGAFKSSPISSLQVLTNEAPLSLRRAELLLKYYYKNKSHIQGPAYNSIVNESLLQFFVSKHYEKPIIVRTRRTLDLFQTPVQPVLPYVTPKIFSHEIQLPQIDMDVVGCSKNVIPHTIIRGIFRDVVSKYPAHTLLFTDGSKSDAGVGAAAVSGNVKKTESLPSMATVFTAEVRALHLAVAIINERDTVGNFLICTDSLSTIEAINDVRTNDHLVHRLQVQLSDVIKKGSVVTVCWIPSHVGISGNDRADLEAKRASLRPEEFIPIPYRNWFPLIRKRLSQLWTERWVNDRKDLYELKQVPAKWKTRYRISRRDEVVINRLRLGHTRSTHGYLYDDQGFGVPRICPWCDVEIFRIKHILINCRALQDLRSRILMPALHGSELSLSKLIGKDGLLRETLTFLKELQIYHLI